jgi:hypothetical protein
MRITFNQQENDMAHTFTTTVSVWISEYSRHDGTTLQEIDDIDGLALFRVGSEMQKHGYTHVGEAEVTTTIASADQITNSKVSSLRAELEKDRADSQRRQNELIDKINKLEALTYDAPEVAA